MSVPTQQKALFIQEAKGEWKVATHTVYEPAAGQVLIRVDSTGLNPVDWKIAAFGFMVEKFPAILGGDGAGIVEEVGEGVTNLKKGDRV